MNLTAKTQHPLTAAPNYTPASGDLKTILDAKRGGFLWRTDLTPERIAAVRRQLAAAERAAQPASPVLVAAWLKGLTPLVTNAPTITADQSTHAIFEVCQEIPAAAWTRETMLAWVRQPERNGFPIGSRWPSPGDLFQHLRPYADKIRDERAGLRLILAMLQQPQEPERQKPTEAEIAAVSKSVQTIINNLNCQNDGESTR